MTTTGSTASRPYWPANGLGALFDFAAVSHRRAADDQGCETRRGRLRREGAWLAFAGPVGLVVSDFGGTLDEGENWPVVKLRVRAGESIQEAVRRFRKLCERSGLRKEMRRKAYYEKPSERRRREELKRLRKARQHQTSRV